MNRKLFFSIVSLTFLTSSCQFNQSIKNDLTTGAYTRGDGIGCNDVEIKVNDKPDNRNTFVYGEKVNFTFDNVTGLTREDGKVFPGLSICVLKNEKDTILQDNDLFAEMEGTDLTPLQLNAHFVAALPYQNEEAYKVFIKIWDKKGDGTLTYEMPFTIEENKLLNVQTQGLIYNQIYLWDETQQLVVTDKTIPIENKFILIMEGLSGFEVVDGLIQPEFSIEILNSKESQILYSPNILDEYENTGIEPMKFKNGQVPVVITFTPGYMSNPCKLKAALTDHNSDRRIDIECDLVIE